MMKRFKRITHWIFLHTVFALLLWRGIGLGEVGPRRLLLFLVGAMALMGPLLYTNTAQKIITEKGRSVPRWIDWGTSWIFIGFLIWNGWIITGCVYLFSDWMASGAAEKAYEHPAQPERTK